MLKTSTQKTINGYSVIDGKVEISMTASVCEEHKQYRHLPEE